jgi:hypothetical protein
MIRYSDDILRYIFETLVDDESDSWSAFRVAMDLSHVSHHWRAVALETPRIWRRLKISLIAKNKKKKENFQEIWDTLCARIKSVPADIEIQMTGRRG